MTKNPAHRLGCSGDESEIRSHVFFKDLNWEALEQRRVKTTIQAYSGTYHHHSAAFNILIDEIANVYSLIDVNYRQNQRMLRTSRKNLQKKSQC